MFTAECNSRAARVYYVSTISLPERRSIPTYALDVKALGWFKGPSGPSVPEDLEMNFFPLDQEHMLIYPAEEEDLSQRVRQRLVPEMLHVHGFEISEYLVAGVML